MILLKFFLTAFRSVASYKILCRFFDKIDVQVCNFHVLSQNGVGFWLQFGLHNERPDSIWSLALDVLNSTRPLAREGLLLNRPSTCHLAVSVLDCPSTCMLPKIVWVVLLIKNLVIFDFKIQRWIDLVLSFFKADIYFLGVVLKNLISGCDREY